MDSRSAPHRTAIPVREAQRRIATHVPIGLAAEHVPLADAWGRRLARDVCADQPIPHFRRSGVDGYAVRASDTAGAASGRPAELDVTESIACGQVPQAPIGAGQAARIMTGAPLPEGADAVIMLEQTDAWGVPAADALAAGRVRVGKPAAPGDNVTPAGREAAPGERLLAAGTRVGAGAIAVLAALGHARVAVWRRPRVAVLATGAELLPVAAPSPLAPGRIRDSNSAMLAALARSAGADAELLGPLDDRLDHVLPVVLEALAGGRYDAVLTSGGVSVGDYDVMTELLRHWDGVRLFDKVQMRPGSVTSVGVRDGRLLFALSGNPSACLVGFELLVRPALQQMQGEPAPGPDHRRHDEPPAQAVLEGAPIPGIAFERYVRGRLRLEGGRAYARPAGGNKSSDLISLREAQCLIVVPPGGEGVRPGDLVEVHPIEGALWTP
ncbi:gephyrin-like molybdotransferase Glp [Paenibacillus sp. HJGM_3]|uniref:molybdopterin molybdotransferase MoeA n=1 Tax=Paenibacillus sp. HJGM_3 TaxID=3379816 RepID=UPI00385C8067